jgi:hypothetical protein
VPAASDDPPERELESEEEEQEDDPELGHEGRHVRRTHDAEDLRLIRPEEKSRGEVRRDRREPETPCDDAEGTEERNRDGELREGHAPATPR